MQLKLPPEVKALFAQRAHRAGLSYSDYFSALLAAEPMDADGNPTWVSPVAAPGLQERLIA